MKQAWPIDVHELTKQFNQRTAVDHVSLQVQAGSVFGFLGANGSGKTTMIRMICGLLHPTSGWGTCLGLDIQSQSAEIKQHIGYMPQKFCLYQGLTVYENLRFFAELYAIKPYGEAIERMATDLELTPYLDILAANLSGGWKQRLTLACCLLHQPRLVFLDEPTAGIDPKARKDLWDYLHKIALRDGTTILVTTHYMDEAEKCTDLAYISLGKLLYSGKTSDLVSFSQVKTLVYVDSREAMNRLSEWVVRSYPQCLVSRVNNTLRISSKHEEDLHELQKQRPDVQLEPASPSFEEVFIGLMPS
jgi:ABC-2 type transport system ATP-binding protein